MTTAGTTVIVVHYRSAGMLGELVADLAQQRHVDVDLHVVECGDDGSVDRARVDHPFALALPGENLGYSGGNNLLLGAMARSDAPICLVNPDVTLPDQDTLLQLCRALDSNPELAAVAPAIRMTDGTIEYTGSTIDLARAVALHTATHVCAWPAEAPAVVEMDWIDGACWMLRARAVRDVGLFDERFFLFAEEVDWCLRAARRGWRVGVLRDVEVRHQRSSSFGGSSKGAYYAWRNTFLLCRKHNGYGAWLFYWLWNLLRFVRQPGNVRAGTSAAALRGGRDAVAGRSGRMLGDD